MDPRSSVIGKDHIRSDDMAVPSLLFRSGSGAMVSQPSSHARAATLTDGRLQEPLLVNAGTPSTDVDTPLVSAQTAANLAAAVLVLLGLAAIGAMMHNRHRDSSSHGSGGYRPMGSAHIAAHHVSKIPPTYDPRFEDRYSFRQYMREMQPLGSYNRSSTASASRDDSP